MEGQTTMLRILRQCWKTAAMSAAGSVGDSPLFVLDYVLRFARVVVLLAIWRTILSGSKEVAGLSLGAILTYTLVAEVFSDPLTCKTDLAWALYTGAIGPRFLWPMGLVGQYASETFGKWAFGLIAFSVPLLLVAPLAGVDPAPASLANGLLFAVSLALAISIGLAIEFIFAALATQVGQNVYAVDRVRGGITALMSGAVLPLAVYPWGIGDVFGYLPFASVASAPLRIYTGTGDAVTLVAIQLFWAVALWPLANWLWRVNRQQLVTFGG
jgi:ABC-2 type transport system permease protein